MKKALSGAAAAWALAVLLALPGLAVLATGFSRARLISPPATPLLEDREGGFLSEGEREYRSLGFWDVEGELNKSLVLCVTELEDRRFQRHLGIDPLALGRSMANNLSGKPRQGGSTIAMQVAALEYPARRTLRNKSIEASAAFFLTLGQGREAVLRQYLKLLPQGNQIFGVGYSARRFFRKPVADLDLAESALLASLAKAPGRMNLFSAAGFAAARERALLVLKLLEQRGRAGPEDCEAARRRLLSMERLPREERPSSSYHFILRALEEEKARSAAAGVTQVDVAAKAGSTQVARYSRALATSLDPRVQAFALDAVRRAALDNRSYDAGNAAAIVADRETGEILAYVGSSDFYDEGKAGSIDYARTPRSSGSILKPFLFALGLDSGLYTPASVLADLPFSVLSARGEYHAMDFDDDFLGPMLYRRALANSRNVPALRLLEGVGMADFHALLGRMGLARGGEDASYYGYGLAIGGLYVTLEDLVAAYGSLANEGAAFRLAWFKGESGLSRERHFSSYAAREIALFLSDETARFPSFPRMGALEFGFPVAIKTGTSQGYRDAWTVAWTDRYIVGLWIGNPDNLPMNRVAGIVSASYVGDIIRFLQPEQERGVDAKPFPRPEGAILMKICPLSGGEAGPDCPEAVVESFIPGTEPKESCAVHRRYPVDALDGRLAGSRTPPSRVVMRAYTVLPPEYALWGARRGFSEPPAPVEEWTRPSVKLSYPRDGARYLFDPATDPRFQSIPLQALVSPRVDEVIWWVDGEVFARAAYPYSVRLPLRQGAHRIGIAPNDGEAPETWVRILVE